MNCLDYNKLAYISLDEHNSFLKRSILKDKDILFSIAGALGIVHIVNNNELPANTNQALSIIRLKNKDLVNYVSYFLQSRQVTKLISEIKSIGAQPNLSLEQVGNFYIKMPSSLSNKYIQVLDLIGAKISTQKKIINNLESLINTIKNKIFNNEVCISKTPLKDILIEINRKSTVNNQFPVISSTVKGLVLQSEYFDKEIASENNIGYKIISKDNIIISPQNLWMGNITYNDKFENGIVSPSYKIFNISEKYNGKYIFEMLTTKKAFYYYKTVSEQGASVVRRNLNYEAFMELMFNVPPKETQDHDIKILESYNDKLTNEKKILLAYEKQKQYLLNHMFI